MPNDERILETIPCGTLGLIPTASCTELGRKVNDYLATWREHREHEHQDDVAFKDYARESYIIEPYIPRFGSGEAKCVINQSVRGYDLFIMVDVTNYSLTYSLCGQTNHMSPDDHFADLKRVIAAVGGKARRITVILPFLYESRQHRRTARESLDCPLALQELYNMGIDNIITFDAHDPRVVNAIPLNGFENVMPSYQFIKGILKNEILIAEVLSKNKDTKFAYLYHQVNSRFLLLWQLSKRHVCRLTIRFLLFHQSEFHTALLSYESSHYIYFLQC